MAARLSSGTSGRRSFLFSSWRDGYPAEVINPLTGALDSKVVAYWHDHYDLTAILARHWPVLGPKLEAKIHLAVGTATLTFE